MQHRVPWQRVVCARPHGQGRAAPDSHKLTSRSFHQSVNIFRRATKPGFSIAVLQEQPYGYSIGPGIIPGCDPLVGRFTKPTSEGASPELARVASAGGVPGGFIGGLSADLCRPDAGKQFFVKAKLTNVDNSAQYLLRLGGI